MGYTQSFTDTMFFRPKFCANCGERIERVDWGPLTSRRFCQVCESEFKGEDLVVRAIVAVGVLVGIFGFGSYLRSGSGIENRVARLQQPVAAASMPTTATTALSNTLHAANSSPQPKTSVAQPLVDQSQEATLETQVSQFFCGAQTKKGNPCSRRVKGRVRCFQHLGMKAMLPAEKLKVN